MCAVLLASGGHFAGTVFNGKSVVAHKTFHRYVVRAEAGKKQSTKDGSSGRSIHSAGASLRRYNEIALKKVYAEQLLEPLLHTILALSGPKTTVMLGYEIGSTVVHDKMLQTGKNNFEVKTISRSKMDCEYQDPSIHLYIMSQKSSAESSENANQDGGVVAIPDKTECETKVSTGACHDLPNELEEEAVATHRPRLKDDSLLMKLQDGKLSEWEMRR